MCLQLPHLFSKVLQNVWEQTRTANPSFLVPKKLLTSKELVLYEYDQCVELDLAPGNNACGMFGWFVTMRHPECPNDCRLIIIANEITYKIGWFGA